MHINIKQEENFQYIEEGKGEVLLLLHGLFGALSNWKVALQHFSTHYRVIIPILPIYSLPLRQSNIDGLLAFLKNFMEFKKLHNITLIGNSLGGHIALVYTLTYPLAVNKLILTASSGLYENSMGGSFIKRHNYNYIAERVQYTFYNPAIIDSSYIDEVFNIVQDNSKVMRIVAIAKSAQRQNLAHRLGEINTPTLLIWGLNDTITPPQVAHEFNALIPGSHLRFIDHCCHAPMMEHPYYFNELMEDFLQS